MDKAEKTKKQEADKIGKIDRAKREALDSAISRIQKMFGEGSIMTLGDRPEVAYPVIPTGSLSLDIATGIGGLPRGRVVEIYGPESSGKTTLTLALIAEAQKMGGVAAFIDVEHALDPAHAEKLGVDVESLLVSQPGTGEEALEIAETLVKSNAVDVIIVDSVAALVPRAELEGAMGDSHVGLQARLMSQALRKLTAIVSRSNTLIVFINQIREKIGVMFGNPETTTGGRALKFYASMRLEIRRGEQLKNGTELVGNQIKVKIVKNKMAPPFTTATFDLIYAEGLSKEGDALDVGVEKEIIDRSGTWYAYEGQRIGQGRENARLYLKQHPEVFDAIRARLLEATLAKTSKPADPAPDAAPAPGKSARAQG